jgi:inhibitor of cysteine peptidase
MKKLLSVLVLGAFTAGLLVGCTGGAVTYTDASQTIDAKAGQEFIIALESNPTTGYGWQVQSDDNFLKLVNSEFESGAPADSQMVGVGGVERFTFKALAQGETAVTLVYKRSWEETTGQEETRLFHVLIK